MCWGMPFSISTFGSSPFLPFFPSGRNPILPIWKSSVAIPLFVLLHSGSPRRFPLAPWEVAGYFLFFAGSFGTCGFYSVSYFLFLSFSFRTILIFLLTVLMCLEGPEPLGSCWGSWLFFFNLSSWISFPSWCFFFWAFKPLGPAISFFFHSPLLLPPWTWLIFLFELDSLLWAWTLWSFFRPQHFYTGLLHSRKIDRPCAG